MLSEKYIAGFLDSDGSVSAVFHGDGHTPQLHLGFSQKTDQDKVLYLIRDVIGGVIDQVIIKGVSYSRLVLWSSKAEMALNRIRKYLVIKRHYANVVLDMVSRKTVDVEAAKKYLKEQRRIKSLPLPNFPSRKWLAGYIDGDGCFSVNHLSKSGKAYPIFVIASTDYDSEGIEVIQKAFGGGIYTNDKHIVSYRLHLAPSKAKQFIGLFVKYLIVKQDQAQLILRYAIMGHYRDGKFMKEQLKYLKAHGHRLNELGVSNDTHATVGS